MKSKTKEMFLKLDNLIRDELSVQGPNYSQKHYISYQSGNYNWLFVETKANILVLRVAIKVDSMDKNYIAKQLGVEPFDSDDSLSDKLNLPSSINIKRRNESSDRITLRIKDDFDLSKPAFLNFLKDTIKNSSRS
jgi:hypothetical protein